MLTKKKIVDGRVRVGFSLPPEVEAEQVAVSGEFNDWSASLPMKRLKSGEWRASAALDAGRRYRFRYVLDGARWENDWAADDYVSNPFGSDDSVVDLPTLSPKGSPRAPRSRTKEMSDTKESARPKSAGLGRAPSAKVRGAGDSRAAGGLSAARSTKKASASTRSSTPKSSKSR